MVSPQASRPLESFSPLQIKRQTPYLGVIPSSTKAEIYKGGGGGGADSSVDKGVRTKRICEVGSGSSHPCVPGPAGPCVCVCVCSRCLLLTCFWEGEGPVSREEQDDSL